jgi:hypothetical protein
MQKLFLADSNQTSLLHPFDIVITKNQNSQKVPDLLRCITIKYLEEKAQH